MQSARSSAASWETKKVLSFSMSSSLSLRESIVIEGTSGIFGDWVVPPPGSPANVLEARYWTAPSEMMLTATPEMMWSTPKVTVAMAWSRPPSMPIAIAPSTPAQAP